MTYSGRHCELVDTWLDGGVRWALIQFEDGSRLTVLASEVWL